MTTFITLQLQIVRHTRIQFVSFNSHVELNKTNEIQTNEETNKYFFIDQIGVGKNLNTGNTAEHYEE